VRGITGKSDTIYTYIQMTKIGVKLEICLGNNQYNFQLLKFGTSENIAKSFRRLLFWFTLQWQKLLAVWRVIFE